MCGRRTFAAIAHTFHRPFFPPAHEAHEACLGVPEETSDRGLGTEARELVRVIEAAVFSHPRIMPVGFSQEEARIPLKTRAIEVDTLDSLPTRFGEEPKLEIRIY